MALQLNLYIVMMQKSSLTDNAEGQSHVLILGPAAVFGL